MDVRRRIPEVTSDNIPDYDIKEFIIEASGYINDALRETYTVPFETVPASIENICSMWAAYLALTLYPDGTVEDDLVRMKRDIDSLLNKYVSGKYSLGSEYELETPLSDSFYFVSTKTKYSYYGVDE